MQTVLEQGASSRGRLLLRRLVCQRQAVIGWQGVCVMTKQITQYRHDGCLHSVLYVWPWSVSTFERKKGDWLGQPCSSDWRSKKDLIYKNMFKHIEEKIFRVTYTLSFQCIWSHEKEYLWSVTISSEFLFYFFLSKNFHLDYLSWWKVSLAVILHQRCSDSGL